MPYGSRCGAASHASPADSAACTALAGRYRPMGMPLPAVTAAAWQWTLSPPQPSSAAAVTKPRRSGVSRRMPLVSSMKPAAAMGRVCAFVVFFLVLLRLAEGLIGPLPPLAAGVPELTNGILRLTPDRRGFVTAAALLGWGGLSVHCQTAAVLGGSGISMRWYLPAKAMQGAVSAVLAAAVWSWVI